MGCRVWGLHYVPFARPVGEKGFGRFTGFDRGCSCCGAGACSTCHTLHSLSLSLSLYIYIPGPPKEPRTIAQYHKTETTGSRGSIVFAILEVHGIYIYIYMIILTHIYIYIETGIIYDVYTHRVTAKSRLHVQAVGSSAGIMASQERAQEASCFGRACNASNAYTCLQDHLPSNAIAEADAPGSPLPVPCLQSNRSCWSECGVMHVHVPGLFTCPLCYLR